MSPNEANRRKELYDLDARDEVELLPEAYPTGPLFVWTLCQRCRVPYQRHVASWHALCPDCDGAVRGCCDGAPLD